MSGHEADPTAGERHPDILMCNGVESREDCDNDLHWLPTTPVPDAASEGLSEVHFPTTPVQCACGWRQTDPNAGTWVDHMSTADEDRARAAERERIAQAIEAGVLPSHPSETYKDGFRRAAQIACTPGEVDR